MRYIQTANIKIPMCPQRLFSISIFSNQLQYFNKRKL